MRHFYGGEQTQGDGATGTDGNGAGVCAPGYHFASVWEMLDISNLKYDTTLGRVIDDSGMGPPAFGGWARTGWWARDDLNCNGWQSNDENHRGTYIDLHPFNYEIEITTWPCDTTFPVWCVED
jgi:hypothetical protein